MLSVEAGASPLARLRVLSGREVCKILADAGFVQVRQRGSHVVMQRRTDAGTTTVPVPDHREVRKICEHLKKKDYRLKDMLVAVLNSEIFLNK